MTLSTTLGTGTTSTTSIQTPADWAKALLKAGGWPQTQSNINFIEGWEAQENGNWGNTASFNPLNTTYATTTSTNYQTGQPGTGVQAYTSWDEGLTATKNTLNENYYGSVTQALAAGNASTANSNGALANALSTWSSGAYTQVGAPNASYDSQTGTGTAASLTASEGGGTSNGGPVSLMGDCYTWGLNHNGGKSSCLVSPPGAWCFSACEAKAVVSGLLIVVGAVTMLTGVALLFAGGKGVAGKVAEAAGAGIAFIPGAEIIGGSIARAGHKQSQSSKAFHADRQAAAAQRKAGISSKQGQQSPAQSQAETARNKRVAQANKPRSLPRNVGVTKADKAKYGMSDEDFVEAA
jgi:hypothetical protein